MESEDTGSSISVSIVVPLTSLTSDSQQPSDVSSTQCTRPVMHYTRCVDGVVALRRQTEDTVKPAVPPNQLRIVSRLSGSRCVPGSLYPLPGEAATSAG